MWKDDNFAYWKSSNIDWAKWHLSTLFLFCMKALKGGLRAALLVQEWKMSVIGYGG